MREDSESPEENEPETSDHSGSPTSIAAAFMEVFKRMGGVDAFLEWGGKHPDDFRARLPDRAPATLRAHSVAHSL